VRFLGKLWQRKFDTADFALAKRKLRTFKDDLECTDATKGNSSFAAVLEAYEGTMLGADSTLEARHYHEPETTLIRSRYASASHSEAPRT
jgi:hypothetical protein